MRIERGTVGLLPYAAFGEGRPIVVFAGVWPATGVGSDSFVRDTAAPLRRLDGRRIHVLNRRPALTPGMSLRSMAGEYADLLLDRFGEPVDVLGDSTGGSIAQLVAAWHPEVVHRLVLVSTGCRLSPFGRQVQAKVAADIRAGHPHRAIGELAAGFVPAWARPATRWGGRVVGSWILRDAAAAADFATTLEAEDGFDLASLPGITAPTLIVGGTLDPFYGPDLFAETARLIPGSSLLITRHGHVTAGTNRHAREAIARFLR